MHGFTPLDMILEAYREGIFPMAESADDEGFAFYKPHVRGLIPIEKLHISHSLLKTLRHKKFRVTFNTAFVDVIEGCAQPSAKRDKTWINGPIRQIFTALHGQGHAHSLEVWDEHKLAGGIYGLALGAVFCGESMFSLERDASKVALVYLCALLWKAGFTTLDTQFINPHLLQFGAYEMRQEEYEALIKVEMDKKVSITDAASSGLENILEEYLSTRKI